MANTQMRDQIVQARVHKERDELIASIREEQICALASSFRNGDNCSYFAPLARSSYNICFFVTFDDGERWVGRIPLPSCLAAGGKKLESEVATMRLVSQSTTIPVPRVIAHRVGDTPDPLSSFVILEYVEGKRLSYKDVKEISDG
ncbi:kinase-like protein [Apiospora sp. TS-2023a]